MRFPRPLVVCILLAGGSLPAAGQTIRGRVLDAATGDPVAAALLTALDSEGRTLHRARSDGDGVFLLRPRSGESVRIRGERTGYRPSISQPMNVGSRDTVSVELRIAEQPLTIDPLTVTARSGPRYVQALEYRGFYARESRGLGDFLHREDLARGAPMNMSQVLDRVPGTTLLRGRSSNFIVFDRSAGVGALRHPPGQGMCLPKIYLDGIHMSQLSGVDMVQPEDVEAVELFHSSSQIPAEYNDSAAACGVILIWTRMSP